jgi:uroporphyrinogen decarboxylase
MKVEIEYSTRERFLRTLNYEDVDRVPNFEFGYWDETVRRWHREGLPQHITPPDSGDQVKYVEYIWELARYFGLEIYHNSPVGVGLMPSFEYKVIEDRGDRFIIQDYEGVICEMFKDSTSMPRYLEYPIKTRSDWERFKERLQPETQGRFPENWENLKTEWATRDYPLGIPCGSLYGWLRNWMGVENVSIAFHEQPEWIDEMMEHLCNLTISVIEKALREVQFDHSWWWEDMCFNTGPLISPEMFREFMVPRYRRVTSVLREYGVTINILDCDGRIDQLLPGWLEAGINCMIPLEAAHNDAIKLKEKYGRDLLICGGVDKRALIGGKRSIDEEMERMARLVEMGGVIPHLDHLVPADVSLDNYRYYLKKKRELLKLVKSE